MARDIFTNQASTTVAASKTAPAAGTTESWTVASSSAFPAASNTAVPATQFYIADPAAPTELILVTNVSGTTWSVTRGADGTTPVTHSAGFTVKNVVPATWLQRIDDRVKKDEYNVLDFGAVGDDSTDNYDAFQDALNAARDNGGGVIVIPKGDYRFQTTPFKIYEGTHILAHPQAHIKNYAGTSASMFWNGTGGDAPTGYAGNGNITIEGGIWDQRGVSVSGAACFSFAHGKNITFRNLTIKDVRGTHAIEINGCQTVKILGCRFEGFYDPDGTREYSEAVQIDLMKGSTYYGAFGAYDNTTCDDILVDGCTFTTSDTASSHEWGRGVGSHNGTIGKWHTNIRVTNNYFNVKHESVRAYSWNRFTIANNVSVDGSTCYTLQSIPYGGTPSEMTKDENGVQQNTSQDFQDFAVTGNVIYGSQSGETNQPMIFVTCESTGQAHNGTISGNTITNCGADAIEVEYGNDITITGNVVKDSTSKGIDILSSNQINVVGNTITSPGSTGITVELSTKSNVSNNVVTAVASNYGILFHTTTYSLCAANRIEDTSSHGIMFTLGSHNMASENHIVLAGQRGVYISGDDDCVVQNNYVDGASRNNATGVAAFYADGTAVPVRWEGNTARKVGSGNEYTYALQMTNGTHHISNNDFEIGKTGRLNLAGTIQGMTAVPLQFNGSVGASGVKGTEWVAPTSGYIRSFRTRLISGSATYGISLNGSTSATGTTVATTSTAANATQSIEYSAGDRLGIVQTTAGSTPTSFMGTLWLIENASDL
jgi:parallel beta-helix repeat protein